MLLNLTIRNWMSFRDETELNLTSSLERQRMETLSKLPGFRSKKALPLAAMYGGNASGKTSIFKALSALREMVLDNSSALGTLPVRPFALDSESAGKPTLFDVTYLAGKVVYRLVVEATSTEVQYESLDIVRERGVTNVYERDAAGSGQFTFDPQFFSESDHIAYAMKSTRANQLFLGSGYSQNVTELAEPYLWFANTLELVGVESQSWSFAMAAGGTEGFLEFASRKLAQLDTGIAALTEEEVPLDAVPKDVELSHAIASLGEDEAINIVVNQLPGDYGFEALTVRNVDGRPHAYRLGAVHRGPNGFEGRLSLGMESSGTQRLLGLMPMLYDLAEPDGRGGSKVYVVDELDRCMHTMLTTRLIEDFTAVCGPRSRRQLLFTTHDLLLMDQSLMRRDEMYVVQRGNEGCSTLTGLDEFEGIRNDKDLIRSYLEGRFGGIPMLG